MTKKSLDLLRNLLCLKKFAIFEQIFWKILRAYEYIRSKNFTKKMPKSAILTSKWSYARGLFNNRDILSIENLSKEEILHIIACAEKMKAHPQPHLLQEAIMGSCFFEPSTRTRLSFETAMHRLGGKVVGFSESSTSSTAKGESLSDTIKTIGQYVDVIVIRHPQEGSAQVAADATDKPIINGGDGTHQHPTQALLDLFTIQECHKTLNNLHIAIVGDLKHARTTHSLTQACTHFNPRLYFVSPSSLTMPPSICHELNQKQIKYSCHSHMEEVLGQVDILYMTRIQKERFTDPKEYEKVKAAFFLTPDLLKLGKNHLKIMHPLPRVNELCITIDHLPQAYYFQQALNGMYVRQALLGLILGKIV